MARFRFSNDPVLEDMFLENERRTAGIQSFQFETREQYAIARLIALGSDFSRWPPNRYLLDFLPTISE